MNANDRSNEGIIHVSKKIFSVQFHPEAAGGPMDRATFAEMLEEDFAGVSKFSDGIAAFYRCTEELQEAMTATFCE